MNIGELAKRSGLTQSRIRFYESIGLLKIVERLPNGYRTYPREAVMVLELINTAQQAGFSLDDIRTLVPSNLDSWKHDGLLATLRRKLAEIETMQKRLTGVRKQLSALIEDIESKPGDITCEDNARRVLARMLDRKEELPTRHGEVGSSIETRRH